MFRKNYMFGVFVLLAVVGCSSESSEVGDSQASDSSGVGDSSEDGNSQDGNSQAGNSQAGDVSVVGDSQLAEFSDRVSQWRASLSQSPSAEVTGREALIQTLVELSRYEFMFELADEVESIEQRLSGSDESFSLINVSVNGFDRVHICPGGGRVLSNFIEENSLRNSSYLFESCSLDDRIFTGNFSLSESYSTRNALVTTQLLFGLTIRLNGVERVGGGLVLQIVSADPLDQSASSAFTGSFTETIHDNNDTTIDQFEVIYNTHIHTYISPQSASAPSGVNILSRFFTKPGDGIPDWQMADFSATGLRADEIGDNITIGQIVLDTESGDQAQLILQTDNGNAETFDLIGFSSADDVNTVVLNWNDNNSFGFPRLYSQQRAFQIETE